MVEESRFAVRLYMNGLHLNADADESLTSVANLLFRNNANAIIIREGGIPSGIITSKDIIRGLISIKKDPRDISAKEVMTKPMVKVHHATSIHEARELMLQARVRMLPVERDSEIIGLMVQSDLLKDLSWYKP